MLFNDSPEIGKRKKYRGGVVIRVDAYHRQRRERGVRGKDNGAAFIVENPKRGNELHPIC